MTQSYICFFKLLKNASPLNLTEVHKLCNLFLMLKFHAYSIYALWLSEGFKGEENKTGETKE